MAKNNELGDKEPKYRLVSITLESRQRTCQNCGTSIKWVYGVHTGTRTMFVGSVCASKLLDDQAFSEGLMDRRRKRASSQWRTQKPPALPGEDKAAYVARRMIEMDNAWAAHLAYKGLLPIHIYARRINERARRIYGCEGNDPYVPFGPAVLHEKQCQRIERKFRSNRFDFLRPSWEVKRL